MDVELAEWFRCCCFHGGQLRAALTRAAAGRTRKQSRRRLRVTTLVRLPPSGVRVRAVHAENGGILPSGLPVAVAVSLGPVAPARHRQRGRPHCRRSRSFMVQGSPIRVGGRSHVPWWRFLGGHNCQQAPREGRVLPSEFIPCVARTLKSCI